jgi:integrase
LKKLLLDTAVWLGMVEDHRRSPLLNAIEQMIAEGVLDLVVPETVFKEFRNCRDGVSAELAKRLSSHLRAVREALPRISVNRKTLPAARAHLEAMAERVQVAGTDADVTLDRIQQILERRTEAHSNTVLLRAAERARQRKAPYHKNKDSFGDALIIESYAELLKKRTSGEACAFVTYNVHDFSKESGDQRQPHDDLAHLFDGDQSRYFVDLSDALKFVDADILTRTVLRVDPSVRDVINEFTKTLDMTRVARRSRFYSMRKIAGMPIGDKSAASLEVSDLMDYCRSQRETASPATVNQHFGYLKAAFQLAAKKHPDISLGAFTAAAPMLRKLNITGKGTARDSRPTGQEIEQTLAFLDTQDQHGRAVFPCAELVRFTLASALRISEICRLEWRHLNADDQSCEIHGRGGDGRQGRAPFRIKLSDEAWAIIQRQPRTDDKIFPYNFKSASQRVQDAMKRCKSPHLSLDAFRLEGEVRMYLGGKTIQEIVEMTGQKSIDVVHERLQVAKRAAQGGAG